MALISHHPLPSAIALWTILSYPLGVAQVLSTCVQSCGWRHGPHPCSKLCHLLNTALRYLVDVFFFSFTQCRNIHHPTEATGLHHGNGKHCNCEIIKTSLRGEKEPMHRLPGTPQTQRLHLQRQRWLYTSTGRKGPRASQMPIHSFIHSSNLYGVPGPMLGVGDTAVNMLSGEIRQ